MIDLKNNTLDLDFFKRVIRGIKNSHEIENLKKEDIIDSFSNNQFNAKKKLLGDIDNLNILDKNSTVVIFGCWFGSILISSLEPKVKKIIAIDLDTAAIRLAKYQFFKDSKNIDWINDDVFNTYHENYSNATLFINTSCEHMPPMKNWPWWENLQHNSYFAFQSNNMDKISGHVNCVYSLKDFESQLPENFKVLYKNELEDERGIRYTLIGKITIN
jgi:hypothetical protein